MNLQCPISGIKILEPVMLPGCSEFFDKLSVEEKIESELHVIMSFQYFRQGSVSTISSTYVEYAEKSRCKLVLLRIKFGNGSILIQLMYCSRPWCARIVCAHHASHA